MKKAVILTLGLSLVLMGWAGSASAVTIFDRYIGADPSGTGWDGKDIIGSQSMFDITKMDVNIANGMMVVDIYSAYFDDVPDTGFGTELGDLFVSIDGWNPVTPTEKDNFYAPGAEDWEFVIALDDTTGKSKSGDVTLHALDQSKYGSDILLSDHFFGSTRYIYREGQEVQYGGSADALEKGSWLISDDETFLRITIAMLEEWSSVSEFGFHYGMTCGNDVIEGGVTSPIPEPAAMFLFGTGLIVLAGFGRRRLLH